MEEFIKKIQPILDQFVREELGNRLSQFAIKGLRDTILDVIKNYKPVEREVKKDAKK